jgi:hypothetical protein
VGNKTKEARIVSILDFFGSDETSLQDLCTADGITIQAARRRLLHTTGGENIRMKSKVSYLVNALDWNP